MGAHSAPDARVARLAGRGALAASAALALAGAGSGVALAHDDDRGSDRVSTDGDSSFLCGLLDDDSCSSDDDGDDDGTSRGDGGRYADAGSPGDLRELFGRAEQSGGSFGPSYDADSTHRSSDADGSGSTDRSGRAAAPSSDDTQGARQQTAATQPAASPAPSAPSLDTPPPPGQVRTIPVRG